MRNRLIAIVLLLSMWMSFSVQANGNILPPEQAFQLTFDHLDQQTILVHFQIAPHYHLYRDQLRATYQSHLLPLRLTGMQKQLSRSMPVYIKHATLILFRTAGFAKGEKVEIQWQGCAPQGMCYVPQTTCFIVKQGAGLTGVTAFRGPGESITPSEWAETPLQSTYSTQGLGSTLLCFYLAGLGLAFTACMYPLIPIVSNIIIGGRQNSYRRAFALTFVYVQTMAFVYAGAGVMAAFSGELLAVYLQQPWILVSLAIFFIFMAAAMLGVFQFQVPAWVQSWLVNKTQHLPRGSYISSVLLGMVSSLIVGPCVAPPLVAALTYIGKEGNIVLGALSLYSLALGIGTPLLVIGILGQKVLPRLHPKILQMVQWLLGFILLGTALWIAMPLLSLFWLMLLLGLLFLGAGFTLCGQLTQLTGHYLARISFFILAMLLSVIGSLQLIGSLAGSRDIWRPVASLQRPSVNVPVNSIPVSSIHVLQKQLLAHRGKMIMLDFYADWCMSCKKMARFTLQTPAAKLALQHWVVLKADVTQNTLDDKALLKAFGLYGPPAIVFFNQEGHILKTRLIGEQSTDTFLQTILQVEQEALQ